MSPAPEAKKKRARPNNRVRGSRSTITSQRNALETPQKGSDKGDSLRLLEKINCERTKQKAEGKLSRKGYPPVKRENPRSNLPSRGEHCRRRGITEQNIHFHLIRKNREHRGAHYIKGIKCFTPARPLIEKLKRKNPNSETEFLRGAIRRGKS